MDCPQGTPDFVGKRASSDLAPSGLLQVFVSTAATAAIARLGVCVSGRLSSLPWAVGCKFGRFRKLCDDCRGNKAMHDNRSQDITRLANWTFWSVCFFMASFLRLSFSPTLLASANPENAERRPNEGQIWRPGPACPSIGLFVASAAPGLFMGGSYF